MTKKTKIITGSVLTILMCSSLAAGATYALFTDQATTNIAITSGKVDVTASVTNLTLYSASTTSTPVTGDSIAGSKYSLSAADHTALDAFDGDYYYEKQTDTATIGGKSVQLFANQGYAYYADNELTLNKITPGDRITAKVAIGNESNVSIKYRTVITCGGDTDGSKELFNELKFSYVGDEGTVEALPYTYKSYISDWTTLTYDNASSATDIADASIDIELPLVAGNEYQDETTSIVISIEAVQANAKTVDDFITLANKKLKESKTTTNATPTDAAKEIAAAEVADIESVTALENKVSSLTQTVAWRRSDDRFVYVDKAATDILNKVDYYVFTDNWTGEITANKAVGGFSYYLEKGSTANQALTTMAISTGLDVGQLTNVTAITYTNDTTTAQDVVIRSNSAYTTVNVKVGSSTVNGVTTYDTVNHYDAAGKVNVLDGGKASYHENGTVAYMEINAGHVVVEEKGSVELMYANPALATISDEGNVSKDTTKAPENAVSVTNNGDIDHAHASSIDVADNQNGTNYNNNNSTLVKNSEGVVFDYNSNSAQNATDDVFHHVDESLTGKVTGTGTVDNTTTWADETAVEKAANEVIFEAKAEEVKSGEKTAEGIVINVNTGAYYNALQDAVDNSSLGDTLCLLKDITLNSTLYIDRGLNVILDMNSKTITVKDQTCAIYIEKGNLNITGAGEIDGKYDNDLVRLVGSKISIDSNYSLLTVGKNVAIKNDSYYSLGVFNPLNSKCSYGVKINVYGTLVSQYGITVSGVVAATSGNIPEIIFDGAVINGVYEGLYLAGYAKTTIRNTTINTTSTKADDCICIAAGELTIENGTFNGSKDEHWVESVNGSVATMTGNAITVAQHSTNLPIIVNIKGGTFGAKYPISVQKGKANGSNYSAVKVNISGGDFYSYTGDAAKVISVDGAYGTVSITGGTYNTDPSAYVAANYTATKSGDTWTVTENSAD